MTTQSTKLTRKGILLLAVLGLTALAAAAPPAMAYCQPLQCPFDPPMHWSCPLHRCVCDCPVDPSNPYSDCGPCV